MDATELLLSYLNLSKSLFVLFFLSLIFSLVKYQLEQKLFSSFISLLLIIGSSLYLQHVEKDYENITLEFDYYIVPKFVRYYSPLEQLGQNVESMNQQITKNNSSIDLFLENKNKFNDVIKLSKNKIKNLNIDNYEYITIKNNYLENIKISSLNINLLDEKIDSFKFANKNLKKTYKEAKSLYDSYLGSYELMKLSKSTENSKISGEFIYIEKDIEILVNKYQTYIVESQAKNEVDIVFKNLKKI
jgi:hypothetical protein